MSMDPERLAEEARRVMLRAHAPYSGFRVGAALLARGGAVHVGCNVENASYGLTQCAERAAVCRAVAEGDRDFTTLVIVSESSEPISPCGACRQVLAEFGMDLKVISEAGDKQRIWTLGELLPDAFGMLPTRTSRKDEKRT
jgi:cytidine deaminase